MPLPANGTAWPPAHLTQEVLPKLREWDAWYVGDTDRLAGTTTGQSRQTFQTEGLFGAVRSFFWGRPARASERENRLHIPVASDIASASSDLLFSEPPAVSVEDQKAQERLDVIMADGLHNLLAHTAEISSVLGGVYLVATTDPAIDHAFITSMDADHADPVFKWGRLHAVTFWTTLPSDGTDVLRYVEVHETDIAGIGVIRHGLYRGSVHNIGHVVPLDEHPVTAQLAGAVNDEATTSTGTLGIDVVYVPNLGPNRRWRNNPAGKHLGRSDLDGVEPLMDALDETYSSLMRDIRLGKSMLVVPKSMLENNGPGNGAAFEQDEIYSPLNAPPGSAADAKMNIEQVQFEIRVEEHLRVASDLFQQIIRAAGYSGQTFGEISDGAAATATEITSRERRSYITRDRKIRSFKPELERLLNKALSMDALVYGGSTDKPVTVQFGDAIQEPALLLAQTAQALRSAEAASTKTIVEMQHPDWDKDDVDVEVALIMEERGSSFADPDMIGIDGNGLSDQFGVENGDAAE